MTGIPGVRRNGRMGRVSIGLLGTLLASGLSATPALGASSIVAIDLGQPKAEIATTVSVRTISEVANGQLFLRYRPVGGPDCAPSPSTDPGTSFGGSGSSIAVGDTTSRAIQTFRTAGTFQVCGWLYNTAGTDSLIATSVGTFAVASPVGAITAVEAPNPATPGQAFVVGVSGRSEVTRDLYTAWRRASEPACGASPSLDPRSTSSDAQGPYSQGEVLGSFTTPIQMTFPSPGRYRFCSWVASEFGDLAPLGVNETIITVASLRPRVASLGVRGRTLTARIQVPAAGQLRVVLVGKARRIVLTARQVQGAQTITLVYRRPNAVKKGFYTLQATFRPTTAPASVVQRSVRLG